MDGFNWKLREYLHVLRKDERLYVLMSIYLHRNIRFRSYPSNADIMKETGLTSSPVSNAVRWFVEHQAFLRVPYGKRVGDERELGKHKNIYQLTGILKLDDVIVPYLHLTPEGWKSLLVEVEGLSDSSLREYLQREYSLGKLFTTQTQSIKESLSLSSSLSSSAVVVVGGTAEANGVRPAPPTARTESQIPEDEAFHRRKTYYQAFEAAFPENARTKVSDNKLNKTHARELFLGKYTASEVTELVRAKLAQGKADYRFHYLMPDLAEARLRRDNPSPVQSSSAPPVVHASEELRRQYTEEVAHGK